MRILIAIFRFVVAFFALRGTWAAWSLNHLHDLIYFTTQSNIFLGLIMLWAGIAALIGWHQPPAWLKSAVLLYMLITGLVAWLILGPLDPCAPKILLNLTIMDIVHIVTPIMATIDFLLFDSHKQLKIKYAAYWLSYPLAYFIFILITIGLINPSISYPYPFIDLNILSIGQLIQNIVIYFAGFYLLGLLIVKMDKILPSIRIV